ncbi:MAG TPA: hypothetical protein VG294_05090 [Solirubrobacteraceae bacterium]|jgi:arginine/lysine/ornithine decarboxylase|nr:hypothetical protein [Solirubrobacteraceae bacterium]
MDYAFGEHEDLPQPALGQGAYLAIGSVHKTLTGLSQTSVLSVGSNRIDTERLSLCFELEEGTSNSALLLSSIHGERPDPRGSDAAQWQPSAARARVRSPARTRAAAY